ncbi:hypothetical protein CQA69_06365 [Campylobacter estrildidarum]|uniref:Phage-Barnase-EndoU-ColicinE5/D-RelE-like nuclease domain-containing protein n=1 Tax=Campylobacter estrildidarum TaxID=2510189 RepID=A0A4U7BNL4_9BACT|nr:hypothetical protein [Campylobacter estrildidarum]TKX30496.1 hypothetical protein CQA69_06365 [Campylobacter estrildidarum]
MIAYNSLSDYLNTRNDLSNEMRERVVALDVEKQIQAQDMQKGANIYNNSPLSNELYINKNMNADELSNYILDKQSKFQASKPFFANDNVVARKNAELMKELGFHLRNSNQGHLLQDDDGSYWVQDNKGNYAKVQGSTMGNLYRGLRDNGASMALGTAGAIGGGLIGGGVGMVAGGALGASLGAGYDYYGNAKDTNQDTNLKEALMLMGENAGLSLAGDAAFAGLVKGARALKNTYNMAKTGAQAGKDMIDGMAVNGSHLKENIGDKFRKISPSVINDYISQGVDTSKAYARDLIESSNANYNDIVQNARTMPLEVNQGNALVDGVASKIKDFTKSSKSDFIKNAGEKTIDSLNNLSKNLGSKEAALNQQDLINLSFANKDLANMARTVIANDPKMANKLGDYLHSESEALLKELDLNNASKADELYILRDTRAKRAYEEFGEGIEKLDELNSKGVAIDKQALDDIAGNFSVYSESTPAKIKEFMNEARRGDLDGKSVKEIYDRIDAIGDKLKKDGSSYNYKGFLNSFKDELLESIARNSDNPQLARNILSKIRKDYADFKVYDKSKIGKKLEGSEETITKSIDKILNETNPKKNYEAIAKGLNDNEVEILDNQIINRYLEKHKINIGDEANPKYIVNYKALMDNLENYKPKSKIGQDKIEVLRSISNMRSNFETIVDGILNSKAKELGHGISSNIIERARTMLVNNFTDYIAFYFMRLWEIGKRAGTRIQMRRGFSNINTLKDFDRSAKEFISSIKDKALKEEAEQTRKEFNSKVKDLIKGDNFFMDKPNPKYAKSDLRVKMSVSPNVRNLAKLTNDEIIADLEYLANKHKEMFKKPSDVFKLIKEIKENPTFFYKNNRMDIALIAKRLNDDKLGKLGISKDTGEVRHATKVKEKDLKRLEKVSKKNDKENVGIIQTFIQPGSKNDNSLNGLPNNPNSTQTKPKKSLMDKNDKDFNPYLKHYKDFIDKSENKKIFLKSNFGDFLDIKKLEKSLEKYKENKPKEIKYKELKRGYILDDLLNVDEDVTYAVVNKDDLKPSLTRSLSQFRNKHSNSTISNIRDSFNEREHFKESSNFDGIPTITKDGLVIAGNHRTTAIKDLKGENLTRYIKQAKRIYGEDVFKGFDENKAMIVRVLDKNDDDTIIRLSKLSNDGRLSDESEKLQALGAKYKEKLSKIENTKLNSEKELMNFLGSRDVLESRRALLDHLMPDIYNALLTWERRSGRDTEFSKILSDNALNFLHLKQALNENKVFKDNGNDFFSLFKRAIESMNQSNVYKSSEELYDMLKKYAEPSLNFEKEFIPNDKDLQADILGFIVKYNDTLTNPSEALGTKIQKAIDFIRDNDSFSLFDEIKLSNYDVLNQMLNPNIAMSTKYQELLNEAMNNLSNKKDLLIRLNENIKTKQSNKSIKQKLDEKIEADKKANGDSELDFLDKMNLNTTEYNLTRQMIADAKESTNKGIKKDIPSAMRNKIEQKLNIKPIKEFGKNYTEYYHDGKGALQKLLIEKQGQVAGAFHRKDLGDIDLVWGNSKMGLAHILERREEEFIKQGLNKIEAKNKALNFIKEIENIINNGNIKKGNNRAFIDTKNSRIMVALDYKGKDKKWIITAYNFH